MKNTCYILLALLMVHSTAALAQLPKDRTADTKIADLLALQPADDVGSFETAMSEMLAFSASDFARLLQQADQQDTDLSSMSYALNSYAYYVMQNNKKAETATFIEGLCMGLQQLKKEHAQAFALELLKKVADEKALPTVSPYLADAALADDAALVLQNIGTSAAVDALTKALQDAPTEKQAAAALTALGALQATSAEPAIFNSLKKYTGSAYQRAAYTALSRIAGDESGAFLLAKAKEVGFAYEPSNAASLSLDYAENKFAHGDPKTASHIANTIIKQADDDEVAALKGRALVLAAQINPKKAEKMLLQGVQSSHASYRSIALNWLSKNNPSKHQDALLGMLPKSNAEVQESVLDHLGRYGDKHAAKKIVALLPILNTPHSKVAALRALSRLGSAEAAPSMIQALSETDSVGQRAIRDLLLSAQDKNTTNLVHAALPLANAATQVSLLQYLAVRSNDKSFQAITPSLQSSQPEVRQQAYKTLPSLVSPAHVEELLSLLKSAPDAYTSDVQSALVAAIRQGDKPQYPNQQLIKMVARDDAAFRAKLMPVFAGVGEPSTLPVVENLLDDPTQRALAVRTLSAWSAEDALPILISLSRTEKGESLNHIIQGMVRLVNSSTHTPEQKTLWLKDAFGLAETTVQKRQILQSLQGTGTFQALAFAGQFLKDADLKRQATSTVMNIALDKPQFSGDLVRQMLEQAMDNLAGEESAYLQAAIARHVEGMPTTAGYVALFNGQDLSGWKGLVDDPIKRKAMSSEELSKRQAAADQAMQKSWKAEDSMLVFSGQGDNIATDKHYGDFEMLVDWKLDPQGDEPDAGIYLRGTPQVQIWDTSRVNVGAQVGSGGLYNNKTHPKDPLQVADNALGEWNSFKIKMIDDKVWVWLNGILVTDSTVLENYWDRSQPIFPMEQIELQAHGSKVWYRDMYLKELPRREQFELSESEKSDGFKLLFDGTNLDQWTESTAYEITPEGYLRANPHAKFGKNLYTQEEFGDFIYRFDFKLTPGANNGVGIRTPLEGDAAYVGTEIQILDNDADIYKNLKEHQYHGSAYGIIPAKREGLKPVGTWNTQEIHVEGNRVKVTLNGVVILDGDLAEASKNGTLDGKDHPGLKNTKGHIGFLGHGSEVFFRNIRIKKL